ncbi:hypothetical protein [Nonomuraea sp. 10N515B]|uniref:hypothetical protein n=1 Tax=Nonomuraea sp. 10N515B TaxID=3457422 RepID=UPI003FCCFB70
MIKSRSHALGVISVLSWLVVITGRYLLWLEYDDRHLEKLILMSAHVVAAISTMVWVLLARGGSVRKYVAITGIIGLTVLVALLPWNGIFARTWFAAHHSSFTALAVLAEGRKLKTDMPEGGWVELPGRFDHLAPGRNAAEDGSFDSHPGRVLILGLSHDEVPENSFLYVYDRPDAARVNPCELKGTGFQAYYRCTGLGARWWWLQRRPDYLDRR